MAPRSIYNEVDNLQQSIPLCMGSEEKVSLLASNGWTKRDRIFI